MAGRGPDERWGRLARLDRGEVKARPSGFPEERPERRNATVERRDGARAGNGTRAPSTKVPRLRRSANQRSAPSWEKGRREGAPRASLTPGADGARPFSWLTCRPASKKPN